MVKRLLDGERSLIRGKIELQEVRKVDSQGRIALPKRWRDRALKKSDKVIVVEQNDALVIRPRRKVDLTAYFDSVKVEVEPKVFADYKELKRALLK